jgi:hypothetical protein
MSDLPTFGAEEEFLLVDPRTGERLRLPIPLMTHTSLNCAPSASLGRPNTTPPSPGWGASSATISRGVGRMTRLPSTSTPPWTRETLRSERSDPW